MDDVENYRGLELFHVGMGLRYKTWKLAQDPGRVDVGYTAESLFSDMMAVRDVSCPLPTGFCPVR